MSDKTISRRGFVSGALAVISAGSFLWLSPASSGYKRQEDIKMRKKVIIESTLKPSQQEKVLPFLEKNLPNVRGFKGCLQVTVFLDSESRKMIFDEDWLSVEHHQQYIKAISENGVMGQLASFLEAPPEIKYFDQIDI